MLSRPRPLLNLVLAALLALTSQSLATARGHAAVAGEIVLCSGEGLVTITVDAQGNPTGPAHYCPDCALSLFVAVESGAPAPAQALTVARTHVLPPAPIADAGPALGYAARGPPLLG
jgi:hypothetical protein